MTPDQKKRFKHLSRMAYIHKLSNKKLTYNEIHELKQLIYLRAYPFQKFKLFCKSKLSLITLIFLKYYFSVKESTLRLLTGL